MTFYGKLDHCNQNDLKNENELKQAGAELCQAQYTLFLDAYASQVTALSLTHSLTHSLTQSVSQVI